MFLRGFRNLNMVVFFFHKPELQSISNLCAELWMGNFRTGLFSTFRIFLHGISDGYFVEDSFCSWSCLVLHVRDSVPNWSNEGINSLSSVCVCVGKLCVSKLCVGKLYVSELCVSQLCVGKLCVSELRVGKLCVGKLCVCVSKLCVCGWVVCELCG